MDTKHVLKDFEGKISLLKKGFKLILEDLFLLIEAIKQSFNFFTFSSQYSNETTEQGITSHPHHTDTLKV